MRMRTVLGLCSWAVLLAVAVAAPRRLSEEEDGVHPAPPARAPALILIQLQSPSTADSGPVRPPLFPQNAHPIPGNASRPVTPVVEYGYVEKFGYASSY